MVQKSKQCEWEDLGQRMHKQQKREGSSYKGLVKGLKSGKLTSRKISDRKLERVQRKARVVS